MSQCHRHPENKAIGTCRYCGRPLCKVCGRKKGRQIYCGNKDDCLSYQDAQASSEASEDDAIDGSRTTQDETSNRAPVNISGFFKMHRQAKLNRGKKAWWIIGFAFSTLPFVRDVIDFLWPSLIFDPFPQPVTPGSFLLSVSVPVLVAIVGRWQWRLKPGVRFTGVRTTDAGIESGFLTVDIGSVKEKHRYSVTERDSGKILAGSWNSDKAFPADSLAVVVFLKEARHSHQHYFFERFVIASNQSVLYELRGGKSIGGEHANNPLCQYK